MFLDKAVQIRLSEGTQGFERVIPQVRVQNVKGLPTYLSDLS